MKPVNPMLVRAGLKVRRYHTLSHVSAPETVGHHTCNVMALIFFLYDDEPPLNVVKAVLHHDVIEFVIGDIPSPVKWAFPAFSKSVKELEQLLERKHGLAGELELELDRALLRYADMMDLCFKAVEELSAGNLHFTEVMTNGIMFCRGLLGNELKNHDAAHELWMMLHDNPHISLQEFTPNEIPREQTH